MLMHPFKVFINPGHAPNGQPDPGACHNGLRESDINYYVGLLLDEFLKNRGYETMLLQHDSLEQVVDAANGFQANLFISIHCDSFTSPSAGGTSAFWHEGSEFGERFGKIVRKKISESLNLAARENHDGTKFYVCKHTAMPACLIELAFISNPDEAKLLDEQKEAFALAIADAIDDYAKTL